QICVIGNGVVRLKLIAPAIGKDRNTGSALGDLRGDLICLKAMLQCCDAKTKLVRKLQQVQMFVGTIAVTMDQTLAFEHLDERFEFQIASRLDFGLARL